MKILNLLSSGGVGGIEQLCKNIGIYSEYDNTFCFLFEEGKIYEEMIENNIDAVSLVNYSKGKFNLTRWKKLCDLTKDYDVITIHHCTIALQIYYILLKRKYKNKKFVMTLHSCFEEEQNYNYNNYFKNIIAKWSLTKSLDLSDRLIFVSEAGKKSYINNFYIDNNKTKVIYNGVESNNYIINYRKKEILQLAYIGRLEKIKGVDMLLLALKKFLKVNKKIKLLIIGDGSEKKNLLDLSKQLKLQNYVEFLGTQRNIGKYLKETDCFIYPSICQEVFGISIVEAMSYGVPCISNNVGGIPEIISDGVNGFITEENSPKGIYKTLIRMINMYGKSDWDYMKKECLETSRRFGIEKTVIQLKEFYEELLYD